MGLRQLRIELAHWKRWRALETMADMMVEFGDVGPEDYIELVLAVDRPPHMRNLAVVVWNGLAPQRWRRG